MLNRKTGLACGLAMIGSILLLTGSPMPAQGQPIVTPPEQAADLEIQGATVRYNADLDVLVFEQQLQGLIGTTQVSPAGQLDGAPVLGYVFPTTLDPEAVGFGQISGILALAVTVHPDFDDTPLWDENLDRIYDNDGGIFHTHWVVLGGDERVPGQLSVQQFQPDQDQVTLPPTNPGMPMYLDSPGFAVVIQEDVLKVVVPAQRVSDQTSFNFDAVAAYMQVNTSDPERPMLGVYEVYSVLSQDLSLPYEVQR